MKVHIVYGWSEGHWHSKLFKTELSKSGYEVAGSVGEADIIIAHSMGCYRIPTKNSAKLLVLIGLPLWRGKHPARGLVESIKSAPKDGWWYKKLLVNGYYVLTRKSYWYKSTRKTLRDSYVPDFKNSKVVLIRNHSDTFMHPAESLQLAKNRGWSYHTIPGEHDDLWIHPKSYIEIISKEI